MARSIPRVRFSGEVKTSSSARPVSCASPPTYESPFSAAPPRPTSNRNGLLATDSPATDGISGFGPQRLVFGIRDLKNPNYVSQLENVVNGRAHSKQDELPV